jgi:hypothetical protein
MLRSTIGTGSGVTRSMIGRRGIIDEPPLRLGSGAVRSASSNFEGENDAPQKLGNICALDVAMLVEKIAVLLSQGDNHLTVPPSAKVVNIEIVRLVFVVLDVTT